MWSRTIDHPHKLKVSHRECRTCWELLPSLLMSRDLFTCPEYYEGLQKNIFWDHNHWHSVGMIFFKYYLNLKHNLNILTKEISNDFYYSHHMTKHFFLQLMHDWNDNLNISPICNITLWGKISESLQKSLWNYILETSNSWKY